MELSISNIAWSADDDSEIYEYLSRNGYTGLEIAPTRVFPNAPYECSHDAKRFADMLLEKYNLRISSMQSIWYGKSESLFASESDRQILVEYTKKAIDFAHTIGCGNLVFGCPKNRIIPDTMSLDKVSPIAYEFFSQIGDYATDNGTCIAIEANPPIYNTNFINTTTQALQLCKTLKNPGIKVNIDIGTMIYYSENIQLVMDNIELVNHVHISEPHLAYIEKRPIHYELIRMLADMNYEKYVSVEMSNINDIERVKGVACYINELSKENE